MAVYGICGTILYWTRIFILAQVHWAISRVNSSARASTCAITNELDGAKTKYSANDIVLHHWSRLQIATDYRFAKFSISIHLRDVIHVTIIEHHSVC